MSEFQGPGEIVELTAATEAYNEALRVALAKRRSECPECGGEVRDAKDGPYRACVACGHVTESDPGFA